MAAEAPGLHLEAAPAFAEPSPTPPAPPPAAVVPAVIERTSRWLPISLAFLAVLVGLLVVAVLGMGQRLSALSSRTDAQTRVVESTADDVRAMLEQQKRLDGELLDLRNAVSAHSREEALLLKAFILKPDLDPELARKVAASVQQHCLLSGRDPNLVLAIMAVESDFNPRATSPVGALGLMQVMPQWRKVLGLEGDLTDPDTSIRAGIQILGFYQEMYRDLETALTAYNRGPGAVDFALMKGVSPANGYAPRVLATYQRLKKLDAMARP